MIYLPEYGKIWDTLFSFQIQFDTDIQDPNKAILSQNHYGIEWVQRYCEAPPRDLSIFFQILPGKNISLLEYMFGHSGDGMIGQPLSAYLDTIFTKENIQDYLLEHFFLTKPEDLSLEEIHQKLNHSEFNDECRYHLLGFCINSSRYVTLLHEWIQKRYAQVASYYEQNPDLIQNIREELSEEALKKMEKDIWDIESNYNTIYYSICLISNYKVERRGLGRVQDEKGISGEKVCYTVGIHWKERVLAAYKKNKVDLNLFGKILSEPNRMKIIEYLIENEEITIGLAVEYLKTSVTATNYHLSMMYDAKMLTARYEGRKIFYSLSKEYFIIAIGMLRDLTDRM